MIYLFIFPLLDSRKNFQQLLIFNAPACWADRAINHLHLLPQCRLLLSDAHTSFEMRTIHQNPSRIQATTSGATRLGLLQELSAAQQHLRTALCPIVILRLWDTQIGISHEEERLDLSAILHPNRFRSLADKAHSQIEDRLICLTLWPLDS